MRLLRITWPQAQAYFRENDMVILAIGSCESHGTHLPLGTDTLIPDALLERIEAQRDIMIAPTLPYGACDYFIGFPGSISLGTENLTHTLAKITEGLFLAGARHFVFLNGHGGNIPAIEQVGYDLSRKGCLSAILNWWLMAGAMNPAWKGGHGGGEETAAIMAIDPALVDERAMADQHIADVTPNIAASGLKTALFKGVELTIPRDIAQITDNSWAGPDHPNTATKAWGDDMMQAVTEYIVAFLDEFGGASLGPVKGYGLDRKGK